MYRHMRISYTIMGSEAHWIGLHDQWELKPLLIHQDIAPRLTMTVPC